MSNQTDVAALTAGVVAVSVTIFVTPGPFDITGAIVALTLGLVLWGYVWSSPRDTVQSSALSAVCGVLAMPIIGFLMEVSLTVAYGPTDGSISSVSSWQLAGGWIVVSLLVFTVDRNSQASP
ncbi:MULTISPECIES: hypothetical protein [unclassified Rhizobium]|uniref:hypothetical protein n=1 Tax=unclassified Rhizobium TaxID=2613769 RepID=UPI00115EE241|nr:MULTISPECIES: hypothetical protein [unclassified Rhizobium]TQX88452.1 hypothetical protein EQW76_11495 [Rhizobium sp. rho-13.1]TQY12647.1 hypothetical protein EQW74_15140 [Rhizobium sp. rho-1.1]